MNLSQTVDILAVFLPDLLILLFKVSLMDLLKIFDSNSFTINFAIKSATLRRDRHLFLPSLSIRTFVHIFVLKYVVKSDVRIYVGCAILIYLELRFIYCIL